MSIPNMRKLLIVLAAACAGSAFAAKPISRDFAADPSVHRFDGKYYLYATNDQANSGKYWDSVDWRLLTSSDLATWSDEGPFLKAAIFKWAGPGAKAWAPAAAQRNGKYYFYAPVGGKQIGVAVADNPRGPFEDAIGKALVESPRDANAGDEPIDPAIFVDDDGQAYMYFGTRVPKVAKLGGDMVSTSGAIANVLVKGYPAQDSKKTYGEAPYLHKHKGVYYFTFSSGWPGQILYATGRSPMGPFEYRGVVFDYLKISTNHQAILQDGDKTWFFYHDSLMPGGGGYKRSISFEELHYGADGSIKQIVPAK